MRLCRDTLRVSDQIQQAVSHIVLVSDHADLIKSAVLARFFPCQVKSKSDSENTSQTKTVDASYDEGVINCSPCPSR